MFQCHDDLLRNDTNYTHDDVKTALVHLEQEELLYKVPTFIYLSFLLLVGIPGNIVVCVIYLKLPPSTPRRFIVALALFDLLNCLVGIPFEIADLITDYFLDIPTLCRLVRMSNTFSSSGSIFILLIISVDRYRKICRPFRRQILVNDSTKCIYVITGFAGLTSIPAVIVYGRHSLYIRGLQTYDCSFDDSFSEYMFPKLYQICLALVCVIAIVVLILLYTFIVLKIVKQKKRRATLTSGARQAAAAARAGNAPERGTDTTNSDTLPSRSDSPPEKSHADKSSTRKDTKKRTNNFIRSSRMTLMMLAVTVVFILGYMPHLGLQITRQILSSEFTDSLHCNHVGLAFYAFFLRSYFLNSAVNPIIYSCYNKRFRQECVTLLKRLMCQKTEAETINTVTDSES
ncbi:orexin receptor type 2-like [Haliotis rubra]|uniref:orexin receptor type 2-like n=1 Tax=Haliotis rubra TaxID=36100 RepID=UPI001EE5E323|nr:orexin receptor type 2-like [Haliotis rubra]